MALNADRKALQELIRISPNIAVYIFMNCWGRKEEADARYQSSYEHGLQNKANDWAHVSDLHMRIASIREEIHHLEEMLWRLQRPEMKYTPQGHIAIWEYGDAAHAEAEKGRLLTLLIALEKKKNISSEERGIR